MYVMHIFDIFRHSDAPCISFAVVRNTAGTSKSNENPFPKNIYNLKSWKPTTEVIRAETDVTSSLSRKF